MKERVMGVNQPRQVGYGLSQALPEIFPAPIVSVRAPTTNDFAQIGQTWINKSTNDFYVLTSVVGGVANWLTPPGGAGTFTSVTATTGDITADLGDIVTLAGNI